MITTTPSRRHSGFTLVEIMIGSALGAFLLAAVLSSFLFIGRSGANIAHYNDMEAQSRKALEQFAEDTRQASAVSWASATSITLVVNASNVTWDYSSGSLSRTAGTAKTLVTGITEFKFKAYTINGALIEDFSTSNARVAANGQTKQIQISLKATRTSATVAAASNVVLSARFVLRNKRVTA